MHVMRARANKEAVENHLHPGERRGSLLRVAGAPGAATSPRPGASPRPSPRGPPAGDDATANATAASACATVTSLPGEVNDAGIAVIVEDKSARASSSSVGNESKDGHIRLSYFDFLAPEGVEWRWEHRTGYRPYEATQIGKIEHAYRQGFSKVRFQSGKAGRTPMEIFFADFLQYDPETGSTRNVQRFVLDKQTRGSAGLRLRRWWMEAYTSWMTGLPYRETFAQFNRRRTELRKTHTRSKLDFTFTEEDEGIFARIAHHGAFNAVTMLAVLLNAFWLMYEVDYNTSSYLYAAPPLFPIVENIFCIIFFVELIIRFLAFKPKYHCLYDTWFIVDLLLVVLMVADVWIIPLCLKIANVNATSAGGVNFTVFRTVRLLRLSRIPRLLRLFPQLTTLLKGIGAALQSVIFTLILLLFFLIVFAIVFRTQAVGALADKYFKSVGASMWTLFVHGTLLDAVADIVDDIREEIGAYPFGGSLMAIMYILYILLSSFTVLNMLIGILCEVVSHVKEKEEDEAEQDYLKNHLLDILDCYDKNRDGCIGRQEFALLMQNPEVIDALQKFGTDTSGLLTLSDIQFEEMVRSGDKEPRMRFEDLLALTIRLRGNHSARVTDLTQFREYVKMRLDGIQADIQAKASVPESAVTSPAAESSQETLLLSLTLPDGAIRRVRHATSMTIGELLADIGGGAGALVDATGVECGRELTLKSLSACLPMTAEGGLELTLRGGGLELTLRSTS